MKSLAPLFEPLFDFGSPNPGGLLPYQATINVYGLHFLYQAQGLFSLRDLYFMQHERRSIKPTRSDNRKYQKGIITNKRFQQNSHSITDRKSHIQIPNSEQSTKENPPTNPLRLVSSYLCSPRTAASPFLCPLLLTCASIPTTFRSRTHSLQWNMSPETVIYGALVASTPATGG